MELKRENQVIVAHSRAAIRKGSKSFSFASRLLGRDEREAAMMLYSWCRYCDDRTDVKDLTTPVSVKEANLNDLKMKTEGIYKGEFPSEPEFAAMAYVVHKYQVPAYYPRELLAGMEMDLYHDGFETFDELLQYCYRVAGVVGLMMVHVLQVSDERALEYAQDMGMAMQLTNIARDIVEDAEMGRVYIPRQWLNEVGLSPSEVNHPESRPKLALIARKLHDEAEKLYQSGDKGISYLPFAAAFSIVAARKVYSAICAKVVRRGSHAWDSRTWIPRWHKFLLLFSVSFSLLRTIPARIASPWKAVKISEVRKFAWPQ